jgi:hypothetical protein
MQRQGSRCAMQLRRPPRRAIERNLLYAATSSGFGAGGKWWLWRKECDTGKDADGLPAVASRPISGDGHVIAGQSRKTWPGLLLHTAMALALM